MIGRMVVIVVVLASTVAPSSAKLVQADLDAVVARLGQATGKVFVVEVDSSPELNAWAASDGRVGVTQGMLNALQSADQLAFVLAHERSHLSKRHHKAQSFQILLGAVLGAVAGKAIGGRNDAELGAEIGAGILGGKQSRKDEYQADAEGLKLAVKAGYNPEGGIEVLQLLQTRYGAGTAGVPVVGWFSSHPDTGNRVNRLRAMVRKLAPRKPAQSNLGLIEVTLRNIEGGGRPRPAPLTP